MSLRAGVSDLDIAREHRLDRVLAERQPTDGVVRASAQRRFDVMDVRAIDQDLDRLAGQRDRGTLQGQRQRQRQPDRDRRPHAQPGRGRAQRHDRDDRIRGRGRVEHRSMDVVRARKVDGRKVEDGQAVLVGVASVAGDDAPRRVGRGEGDGSPVDRVAVAGRRRRDVGRIAGVNGRSRRDRDFNLRRFRQPRRG